MFRRNVRKLLEITAGNLLVLARRIYADPMERRVAPWFAANGDSTFRLNYSLTEKSIVLDVGGYKGQWASDIFAMYGCTIHIFEPVPQYAEQIAQRFRGNSRIVVHRTALGVEDGQTVMGLAEDGSSLIKSSEKLVDIKIQNVKEFFDSNGIGEIDLMKINIEGAEYDLLEYMIAENLVERVKNLQIQFHDFVPDAERRMRNIKGKLVRTHCLTYEYEFVWENWCRLGS